MLVNDSSNNDNNNSNHNNSNYNNNNIFKSETLKCIHNNGLQLFIFSYYRNNYYT